MAYSNFIPEIWSESIQRNLERLAVFAEDCNRQYEGDVQQKGDTVHILGVARPTIYTVARANASNDITAPQEVTDNVVDLVVDQIRYFNYMVGDIDKAQAVNGLMDTLSAETSEGLAHAMDVYLADFSTASGTTKLTTAAQAVTSSNVLDILDSAIEKLYTNDVNPTTELVVTVSPRFYTLFKKAYVTRDTDNSTMMKNGKVAMYGNVTVKMSNYVTKTTTDSSNDTDNILIRTKRALAFVNPLTHIEPYRPEKKFADAVKGYTLFGAKVVRSDELLNINVKY